jgi:hypothetical protein
MAVNWFGSEWFQRQDQPDEDVELWFDFWFGPLPPPPLHSLDTPLERWRYVLAKALTYVSPVNQELSVPTVTREFLCHEDARMIKFPYKDPDERDDFKLHWVNRLAPEPDTIATSTWEIITDMSGDGFPLNIYDEDIFNEGLSTRCWLEGGTDGNTYLLLNEVVTVGARTLQQTIQIKVKSR